jgi:hypothetical protein
MTEETFEFSNENATLGLYEEPNKVLYLKETPFNISFSWKDQKINVQLENGEDVLKLATIFSDMLSANNIPHKVINE